MSLITNPLLYWGAAVLVVLAATAVEAQRTRLDPWTMFLAGLVGFGGAVFGGDLYVLATEHADDAGRAAIGAFVGAGALGWMVVKFRSGVWRRYADAAVPGIALGYAVYRIGCFLNGCCAGIPTGLPWGTTFGPGTEIFGLQVAQGLIPPDAARTLAVHPTQLYHLAVGLIAFVVLSRREYADPGRRLALALFLYGTGRFWIEFLRADAQPVLGPLDVNQIFCLGMLVTGLLLWRSIRRAYASPPLMKQGA